jgi:prevent-host-death family protein
MSEFSIAQAKSQFAHLVQQAEAGDAVHITRRGRPVAVLVSGREYKRLSSPHSSLFAFTTEMRLQAAAADVPLFEETELAGLRDQSERPAGPDWV